MGQGGLARETLDNVPEAMQSLPPIPCLPSPLFLCVYSYFVFTQHFITNAFKRSEKLKESEHLIFLMNFKVT